MTTDTVYAVCDICAHVEPRPQHAAQDWAPCENCGSHDPLFHEDPDFAEDASEAILAEYREHSEDLPAP